MPINPLLDDFRVEVVLEDLNIILGSLIMFKML